MKNLGTIVAALFVVLVLLAYMCSYQVRFTEVAIEKTWGKPAADAIDEPGLKFKWPPPIQTVVVYDKRTRVLEDRTEETRTIDSKNLVLSTYTLWRIADAAKFHTNFPGGIEDGEKKLRTSVISHKQAIVGQHRLDEFISTDPSVRRISEIENEIREAVAKDASTDFGIQVLGFGIKKLALPEAITTEIFASMKSREQGKAASYRASGEARANDILANARAAEGRILAAAREKTAEIETEAQRVVSDYYKEFNEHPELRIFLDTLRTVEDALRERTTLIMTADQNPITVFDEEFRRKIPRGGSLSTDGDSAVSSALPAGGN